MIYTARLMAALIAALADGLKGFPEAIESVFPKTQVQLCIVHMVRMVRNSLNFVSWKQRKEAAADLRKIYAATTETEAAISLDALATKWDSHYPQIAKSWRSNWARVTPFFGYAAEIRKAISAPKEVPLGDTTNAIASVNFSLRKLIKNRASFPNDDAAMKLLYLRLRNIAKRLTMPIQNWKQAMSQLMVRFEDRFNPAR